MGKFCTNCSTPLIEGAKFCVKCGVNVIPVSEEDRVIPDSEVSKPETVPSKNDTKENIKASIKAFANEKSILSGAVNPNRLAGELVLPLELGPALEDFTQESFLSLLKGGFRGLVNGFKRTLGDKKRLMIVIALAVIWLIVNLLNALGISSLPLRVISWLTVARGSLVGGSVAKGLLASLMTQLFVDKGVLKGIKDGIGKLLTTVKGSKNELAPLLLGAGAGLIACNIIAPSNLQNTIVCVAGFALSAKALSQNGFLRRLIASLYSKASNSILTALMGGWTLGFALFAAVSLLPGGNNGYLIGFLLLIAGCVLAVIKKNLNKEVSVR